MVARDVHVIVTTMRVAHQVVRALGRALLPESESQRLARLQIRDAGHGYDLFGMHPDWIALACGLGRPFYRGYFRVSSHGFEHLPARGAAILVANHAGTLPIDGAMLCMDVLEHTDPPRMPRAVADRFIPELPFVSASMSRVGVVSGTLGNVRRLLEASELCLIFPEGTAAIGKPYRDRYELREWHVGHAELALRYGVPVIPVAIIGSEEQWPQIGRLPVGGVFGMPYVPVPLTPLPLPVRYRILYGEPLQLAGPPCPAPSADAVAQAADVTRAALSALITRGLAERRGIFR